MLTTACQPPPSGALPGLTCSWAVATRAAQKAWTFPSGKNTSGVDVIYTLPDSDEQICPQPSTTQQCHFERSVQGMFFITAVSPNTPQPPAYPTVPQPLTSWRDSDTWMMKTFHKHAGLHWKSCGNVKLDIFHTLKCFLVAHYTFQFFFFFFSLIN